MGFLVYSRGVQEMRYKFEPYHYKIGKSFSSRQVTDEVFPHLNLFKISPSAEAVNYRQSASPSFKVDK